MPSRPDRPVIPATFSALLRRPVGAGLVLFTAALLAYGGSLNGSFLWDDTFLVEQNPFIRSPALFGEAFRHFLFFNSATTFYRPLQTLSYGLDYALWGLEPSGYRLTNLLLHATVAWLLYALLCRLLPRLTGGRMGHGWALGVALVWVVHPTHHAVVAYVAGRADSLAAGFALLAWWLYDWTAARGAELDRPRRTLGFGLAMGALLASLLSKEVAAIWIALFAGWLFAFGGAGEDGRGRVPALGGALLTLGIYAALRFTLPSVPPGVTAPAAPALAPRVLLAARALGDYGGLLLWPGRLCMERQIFPAYGPDYNPQLLSYFRALTFIGPIFGAILAALAGWPGPGRRLRAFGAGWFLTAFLPVSNLFVLNATVAEHWLYVPSIGFLLLLAGLGLRLTGRARTVAVVLVFGVAVPALLWRTNRQAAKWTERERFVTRTISDGGDSPRMRNMLASLLAARGDLTGGERLLRELLRQSPANAIARLNLANNLRRQGHPVEAATLYTALAANPTTADPRPSVQALSALDELTAAGTIPWPDILPPAPEAFDAAVRRVPHFGDLALRRADRLAQREGRPDEAIRRLQDYLRTSAWDYAAWMRLGESQLGQGDAAGALDAYAHAGELDIRETQSWLRRAVLLVQLGRVEEARPLFRVARRRGSTFPEP